MGENASSKLEEGKAMYGYREVFSKKKERKKAAAAQSTPKL